MIESKHLNYPTHAHGAFSAFQSYKEEAWWDETDTGEQEIKAEMTPVKASSKHGYYRQMMLRLDDDLNNTLEAEVQERGMKKAILVRQWLKERLHQEKEKPASRKIHYILNTCFKT